MAIKFDIRQKFIGSGIDIVSISADKFQGAGLNSLRAFGCIAQNENRFAERRGFFLDAATIRHDEIGALHEVMKVQNIKWSDKADTVIIAEDFLRDGLDFRVKVDRVNNFDVVVRFDKAAHSGKHLAHRLAEVFAAVRGDENEAIVTDPIESLVMIVLVDGGFQSVDSGVAGDEDFLVFVEIFFEMFGANFGGSKKIFGDTVDDLAVDFFRKWRMDVISAEAGFDMADRNLLISGSESASHSGRRVAMNKHDVGPLFNKNFLDAGQSGGGDMRKGLVRAHDVKVVVGSDVENFENLVEHVAMLSRDADDRFDVGTTF